MNRYLIFCCPGSGGMFLSSVLAKILGYDIKSQVSATGNVHDIGQGVWASIESCVCLIGDFWELNYRPNQPIYYSHVFNDSFWKNNPDVNIIKIQAQPVDYCKVAELYVKKAWPAIWTQDEYNKWASENYPPYSQTNITESELICNDLINDLKDTTVKNWHNDNIDCPVDYYIDFQTVMGINTKNVIDELVKITGKESTDAVHAFVCEYQKINKKLYFNQ